jgi:CO/xanthine dehydrogenase Mo-binding subunit
MKRASQATETSQIGRAVPRLESWLKVTGRAEYVHNLRLPGMLYGKIFRSTVAHGRIKRIDTSAARAMAGVHSVVTATEVKTVVPDPYYGPAFHDQPVLALDKVRYVGEPVAVVLASDPHVAEEAVHLITAEYDELPAVYDEVEAVSSKAIVHDALRPAGTFPDLKHLKGVKNTNVALDFRLRRGDSAKAMAGAARVFEHRFRTQQVMHTPLEPLVSVAECTEDSLTIHTASQSPSFVRIEIARLLGWPENRVRVRVPFLGGGFGAKLYIKLEALVAVLSLLVKRPVKISLSMEEQFFTITKHASTFRIKSGVNRDGRIVARECEVWWNGGAYADIGPRVTQKSGFTAPGPYDVQDVAIDSYALYTNLPPAGALRGFGIPQLVWAYESHTDMIAREFGIDPLEFRRRNLLRDGRPQATGTLMKDAAIDKVLERTAELMEWAKPYDRGSGTRRRGRGIAIGFKACIANTTSQCRWQRHGVRQHGRHGAGLGHRHGADRGRGAAAAGGGGDGGAFGYRRHALRHGDARLALALPHRKRGEARRRGCARATGCAAQAARPRRRCTDRGHLQEEVRHARGFGNGRRQFHPALYAAR